VNIGTGQEIRIRDLAETIAAKVGFSGRVVWDTTKPNGQPCRCLDVSRAKERFGFEARCSLSEGLETTIAWFVANRKTETRRPGD
jgi:GDP-L-fucose synthase